MCSVFLKGGVASGFWVYQLSRQPQAAHLLLWKLTLSERSQDNDRRGSTLLRKYPFNSKTQEFQRGWAHLVLKWTSVAEVVLTNWLWISTFLRGDIITTFLCLPVHGTLFRTIQLFRVMVSTLLFDLDKYFAANLEIGPPQTTKEGHCFLGGVNIFCPKSSQWSCLPSDLFLKECATQGLAHIGSLALFGKLLQISVWICSQLQEPIVVCSSYWNFV